MSTRAGFAHRHPVAGQGRRPRLALVSTIALVVSAALMVVTSPAGAAQGNIHTVAGNGTADDFGFNGYTGDGTPATTALISPRETAIDAEGNLLILDAASSRLRIVAESAANPGYAIDGCTGGCTWTVGDAYTMAGTGAWGYSGDGGPATMATLRTADVGGSLVIDAEGNPIIVDEANYRLRVIAESAADPGYVLAGCAGACTWTVGDIYTIAGNGSFTYSGDGMAATSAGFDYPQVATLDAQGNVLVVSDDEARVRVVAVSAANPGYPLAGCSGPCTWTVGDIYTIAGNGTVGYNGDGIPATSAEFSSTDGLAVDPEGNVAVADGSAYRIRVVAISASNPGYLLADCGGVCTWTAGDIYTIAGNGTTFDYRGDGGPATSAGLTPSRLTFDHHGNLLNADGFRVRVIAVSAANPSYDLAGCARTCTWTPGGIYTVVGNGTRTFSGDGGLAIKAGVAPGSVTVDAAGNLYVSDVNRLREVIEVQTVPGAPVRPLAQPGNANARVSWTAPDSDGGLPITGYVVTPLVGNAAQAPQTFPSNATAEIVTGLTNGTRYTFTVAAINSLGTGAQSRTPAITAGTPAAPIFVQAASNPTSEFIGSIRVTYLGAANVSPAITKFTATCTPVVMRPGVTTRVAVHVGASARPLNVGGVIITRNYTCTVSASNAFGDGPASTASARVPVGAPGAPTGTHPVRVAAGQFKVNFSPGPNNGDKTRGYIAVCTSTDRGASTRALFHASPITVGGLIPGAKYTCTVAGTNSRGAGPPSAASAAVAA